MFNKVLIANRGEILVRICRTLKTLNIASVAVYSEADRFAPGVLAADEAVCIGPAAPAQSYLNIEAIIEAARQTGAEAVHPGYGFLSERADFARRLAEEGIVFIGPDPRHLEDFGLKHTARALAQAAGLPMLPGTGLIESADEAARLAAGITYPVMLKSSAGGGGIGMVLCENETELRAHFERTAHLAASNFGHAGLFIEKYVARARHIEVQIFGDGKSGVVALGARDCSLQRRHQKIIEETPAPNFPRNLLGQLQSAAIALARSVGYSSAGTVEFVYDAESRSFYFLEVNTRLQVEHGITEAVFGIDLVEWMVLHAAKNFFLPPQATLIPRGAAIEARIYAEIPAENFRPASGTVSHFLPPRHLRVDGWIEAGTQVSPYYDPMLAKIIATGETREMAIASLRAGLREMDISGIETNTDYCLEILDLPDFRAGQMTTRSLERFIYQPRSIAVLEGGAQAALQSLPGRLGYWEVGVPPSGPMDDRSFTAGNVLLGNPPGTTALEITLSGPTLRFDADAMIALTGAEMQATLEGAPVRHNAAVPVQAGQILSLGGITGPGQRTYLAVAGGFSAPDYLGSNATFTLGGFGGHAGRNLAAGDTLRLADPDLSLLSPAQRAQRLRLHEDVTPETTVSEMRQQYSETRDLEDAGRASPVFAELTRDWRIALRYGPHGAPDFFEPADIETLFSASYEVHHNSARTGVRLIGPKPRFARADGGEAGLHPSNIHDNAYAVGAIDFTGDMPIILGPDGPSLGGFVCPAVVTRGELWKIGQLAPGDRVRFTRADDAPAVINQIKDVVVRAAGDEDVLVEFGEQKLDFELRLRAQALRDVLAAKKIPGVIDLTPGIRSLQVHFDAARISRVAIMDAINTLVPHLPPPEKMQVKSRILHLPLAWNPPEIQLAMRKYQETTRPDAPWCPDNIEFIRRINGLQSLAEVKRIVLDAAYVVLGLGDVYLGAPVATPYDPRHRLVTTKYNPARPWTPENAVGIGGAYMCIYGMEGPGGYQLFGRTVQVWNTHRQKPPFEDGKPWLLRHFDQIKFFEVTPEELHDAREKFLHGKYPIRIEETTFSLQDYRAFCADNARGIAAFQATQRAAFAAERADWAAKGLDHVVEKVPEPPRTEAALTPGERGIASPVAGSVWQILRQPGETVAAGEAVMVLESMKMEVRVPSPAAGVLGQLSVAKGELVRAGQRVAVLAGPKNAAPAPEPAPLPAATPAPKPEDAPELLEISAIHAAYRNGTLTPVKLVTTLLQRIDAYADKAVFISRVPHNTALAEATALRLSELAQKPLLGIPFVVKDNIDTAGLATTAACPGFAYMPEQDATVVARLRAAGAILLGKTNLDQFATGLNGTRSPYGAPRSVFNADYISGGSSSGSAVAVAAGLAAFSLGTDTAGSGRVPAAFNNLIGLKPSFGRIPASGCVPTCRSLDCVSILANSTADALTVLNIAEGACPRDAYSREAPPAGLRAVPRVGFLARPQRDFGGDEAAAARYEAALAEAKLLGWELREFDHAPFAEVSAALYGGPLIAERLAAIKDFYETAADFIHPVVRGIIAGAEKYSAADLFMESARLRALMARARGAFEGLDFLLLPTAPTIFRVEEMLRDPVALNARLGLYTQFVNIMGFCGIAVPAGFRPDGLPFGVTLIGPDFAEEALASFADALHVALGAGAGISCLEPASRVAPPAGAKNISIVVAGAHLSGMALNPELRALGAKLLGAARTAPEYKLFALKTTPAKPGLVRAPGFQGPGIAIEVWSLTPENFGVFVASLPVPMGIGKVTLSDGSEHPGFLCEPHALHGAEDITRHGGWRAYRAALGG